MAVRSRSIDALYRNIKAVWPGVVIGWIGDPAHAQTVSDHNPDDTAGVRAAQTDPDTMQEVRALDVMLGSAFTRADADGLVLKLTGDPATRARLYYVIWYDRIWHRADGWLSKPYQGTNRHTTHVHISGWAGDDGNGADWPNVLVIGGGGAVFTIEELLSTRIASGGLGVPAPGWEIRDWLKKGEDARQAVERLAKTTEALVDAIAGIANRVESLKAAIDELNDRISQGQAGNGPTAAQIAEEFGTRLSTP